MTEGVVQRTRQELLQALESSQAQVVQLLESMHAAQDWQPESAEWSFRLIAGHLASVEESWHLQRIHAIAGNDRPTLAPFAEQAVDIGARDLTASLQLWVATRKRLLEFVAGLAEQDLARVGVHETLGPMSILDILDQMLRQDQVNLRHVHQLIIAYYETPRPAIGTSHSVHDPSANHDTVHHNEAR